jgi:two-component system sensor histidine kinase UhpB
MWRSVPLQYRLNLLFAALLLAWLVIDVGRMLAEAGPRARADSENVTGLTRQFVVAALANVQASPEPGRDLVSLLANLQNIRHIRIGLITEGDPAVASAFVATTDAKAPAWFRAIEDAPISVVAIPVVLQQHRLGSVLIVADSSDEIDQVWSASLKQAAAGGALALAVLFGSSFFIRWALRPLGLAGTVLATTARA